MSQVLFAFSLTLLAGVSTGIGSLVAMFLRKESTKFSALSLGFSAGVMIYISMLEILPKSTEMLESTLSSKNSFLVSAVSFFGGMLLIWLIDMFIPTPQPTVNSGSAPPAKLMRTGIMTAVAISIHNFPEGLVTFVSALREPTLAIPVFFAVAIHNIPEGIVVSVPVYSATGSRKKAFWMSFLSGLTEPLGALIGWLILMPFMSDLLYGILFGIIAGIMVFISLDELFPTSMEYGNVRLSVYGVIAGMAVMALSLWLFI